MLVKKITGESEIYKVFKKREKKLVFQKQFRQKHFFEAFFVIDNTDFLIYIIATAHSDTAHSDTSISQ